MGHIFISYAREDRAFVGQLARQMRDRGIPVWDDSRIEHGAAWYRTTEQHLDESAAVVLVMSRASRNSTWVTNELLRAQRKGIPVRPLLVDGDPWLAVESVNFVDLRDGGSPDKSFFEDLLKVTSSGEADESKVSDDWVDATLLLPRAGPDAHDSASAPSPADVKDGASAPPLGGSGRPNVLEDSRPSSTTWAGVEQKSPPPEPRNRTATRRGAVVAVLVLAAGLAVAVVGYWPNGSGGSGPTSTTMEPIGGRNVPGGDDFRVNFQRRNAEVPDGYLVDFGQPFGEQPSGLSYGWVEPGTSTPMDMTAHARDRDRTEDQLRDTLMHFRNWNPATKDHDVGAWELAVENGSYLVRVVVGEPRRNNNLHNLTVEGVDAIKDFVSAKADDVQEDNTVTVTVDDGRLTLETIDEGATKIAFVEIERLG